MDNKENPLSHIYKNAKAYKQSLILLSANELGIFDCLYKKSKSAEDIAKELKLNFRGLTMLLNALVLMKMLKKSGKKYSNLRAYEPYLVKSGKYYIGSSLKHDLDLVGAWKELPTVIRSGKPVRKEKRTPKEQENFILAMANSSELKIDDFFNNVDLSTCRKFLDVGGGPGTFCLNAVKKYKKLTAYNFDLSETIAIAKKYLSVFKEKERIKLLKGDFFKDDFGDEYDVILLSNIIHSLGEKDIISLFKKSYKSIAKGGKLIVKDFYIHESRLTPVRGVLFAINMLVNTPEGNTYTVKETTNWLKKAGFSRTKYVHINEDVEFIEAYK